MLFFVFLRHLRMGFLLDKQPRRKAVFEVAFVFLLSLIHILIFIFRQPHQIVGGHTVKVRQRCNRKRADVQGSFTRYRRLCAAFTTGALKARFSRMRILLNVRGCLIGFMQRWSEHEPQLCFNMRIVTYIGIRAKPTPRPDSDIDSAYKTYYFAIISTSKMTFTPLTLC